MATAFYVFTERVTYRTANAFLAGVDQSFVLRPMRIRLEYGFLKAVIEIIIKLRLGITW